MKKIIVLILMCGSVNLWAQENNNKDSITYANLPIYGHSLVYKGKHLNLKKVAKSYANQPEVQLLYHQIIRRRYVFYPVTVIGTTTLSMGLVFVLLTQQVTNLELLTLLAGGGLFFWEIKMEREDIQDFKNLAKILP